MSKCFNSFLLPCLEYYSPVCGPQLHILILGSWKQLCLQLSFNYQILVLTCGINVGLAHYVCCTKFTIAMGIIWVHFCLILLFLPVISSKLLLQIVSHFLPSHLRLHSFPGVSFWPQLTCGMACLVQLWSLLISRILRGEQIYSFYLLMSTDSHFHFHLLILFPLPLFYLQADFLQESLGLWAVTLSMRVLS